MATRRLIFYAACPTILLTLASRAVAQEGRSQGWWFDLGAGIGWNVTQGANAGHLGLVWQAQGGGTISPHARLGVGFTIWSRRSPLFDPEAVAGNTTVDLVVLGSGTLAGIQARVGVGLSDADLWNQTVGKLEHAWGLGATLALAYGLRVARRDYLVFRVGWMPQTFAGRVGRPTWNHTLSVGLGLTSP
jgi:hypothetical protein